MSDSTDQLLSEKRKATAEISGLEADLAYFSARISMLGTEPETLYQKAQLKTYQIIESQLNDELSQKRREYAPLLKK